MSADRTAAARRRVVEGMALTACALAAPRRLPTFVEIAHELRGVTQAELAAALGALVERGLLVVEEYPAESMPLLNPPVVRYRPVGLRSGASLISKAGA